MLGKFNVSLRWPLLILAVCGGMQFASSLIGWNDSLLANHSFRQAQTALLIRDFAQHGVDLRSPLPFFGPPWYLPFEFPLYQTVAAGISNAANCSTETAARTTSLLFFYLGLPAAYLLLRHLKLSRGQGILGVSLLLVTPVYLYYSRTCLIESTAWCFSLWFLLGFLRGLSAPNWSRWCWLAMGAGCLAGLAKVTTFTVTLVPAILLTAKLALYPSTPSTKRGETMLRIALKSLALVAPGLLVSIAWIRMGDGIKEENPLAADFVSASLRDFTMGTLSQRFSSEFWITIWQTFSVTVITPLNIGLLVVFGIGMNPRRNLCIAMLGCFLAGPLIFANLYAVHDYYFYASAWFLSGALMLAWIRILAFTRLPVPIRVAVIALSLLSQFYGYTRSYLARQGETSRASPDLAEVMRGATAPDNIVVALGEDWNPVLPYYSERKMVMILDKRYADTGAIHAVLDRLEAGSVGAVVVSGEIGKYPAYLGPIFAKLGIHRFPSLTSSGTAIYLSSQTRLARERTLRTQNTHGFRLRDQSAPEPTLPQLRFTGDTLLPDSDWSHFDPAPSTLLHPFGLTFGDQDGRTVLDAHVPTDLVIKIPTGATSLTAAFGVRPGAYADPASATDGVEFRFELHEREGAQSLLDSVLLQPNEVPADRGLQTITMALPSNLTGELWLRTRPGQNDNIAYDWAYWAWLTIH